MPAAGHSTVLLATEMRRLGMHRAPMLIRKPNNTLNLKQSLDQVQEKGYVKASAQPPDLAWQCAWYLT